MENDVFVDTNVLIYLLDGNNEIVPFIENKILHVSFVTEMELLSKNYITKIEIKNIQLLLDCCILYDFTNQIKKIAVLLMRNNRLKLADAIIASTANYYNIPLITADARFQNIEGCTIIKL